MNQPNPDAMQAIVSRVRRLLAHRTTPLLVALDGQSGTGKSTLAAALAAELGAAVVDGDDFYTGGSDAEWDARTAEERVARCIDWRGMRSQVLEPLLILNGAYSSRPELSDLIDLSVLVETPADVRRERLVKREGAIDEWHARWDEAETYYFTYVRPRSAFDLVVSN